MLTGDNEGCLSCCGEQGYPVATLPGEQRRSGRKPYRTMDTECLAGAGYLGVAYLSCRFGIIIEPTVFIMNIHQFINIKTTFF